MTKFEGALLRLKSQLPKDCVSTNPSDLLKASVDNSRYSFLPQAVVFAKKPADVGKVLETVNINGIPVSVRGAGSGASGAALPVNGGIVLDVSGIDFIEIDPVSWTAHAGAGAINANIDKAAMKHGLMYPPDPSSKNYSTIGGNIACNAGGLRAAKYGVTRDYVLALSGYLPTGEAVNFSRPLKKCSVAMNMRDLWIGAEGTLGVITEAWLKLIARPPHRISALATFESDTQAFACVREILKNALMPSVLEFLDADSVRVASEFTGAKTHHGAMLLIEFDGSETETKESAKRIKPILKNLAQRFEFSKNETEAEKLWAMRRAASPAMYKLGNAKLNQDIVLPISATDKFFDFYKNLGKKTGLPTPTFGHAADGNYHIHFMYDASNAAQKETAYEAMDKTIAYAVKLGGSISGEHGIGIVKTRLLENQISHAELSAMKKIKNALDPKNILNNAVVYGNLDIKKFSPRTDLKLPWDKA